jgi:hypothetical protein
MQVSATEMGFARDIEKNELCRRMGLYLLKAERSVKETLV